jgi:hypothetical protein
MTGLQLRRLRIGFNGNLELGQTAMITARILVATAIATVIGWLVWKGLDAVIGGSFTGDLVGLLVALGIAVTVYSRLVLAMRVPEARQVQALVVSRLGPILAVLAGQLRLAAGRSRRG